MCPPSRAGATDGPNQILLARRSPMVDDVIQNTLDRFRSILSNWHGDILAALESNAIDLTTAATVRIALRRVLNPYADQWDLVVTDMWQEGARAGREASVRRHSFEISYDISRDSVTQALQENGQEAARMIKDRMVGDLSEALAEANEEGLSIDEITETLQDDVFPGMEGYQARRVARTSVIAGSNKGSLSSYQEASGVEGKKWLSTDDPRTRRSHDQCDGQERPLGKPFTTGAGNKAMYPGAFSLPVSDRVNCRCSLSPIINL